MPTYATKVGGGGQTWLMHVWESTEVLYSIHMTDNEAKAVFRLVYRNHYITENLTVGVSAALVWPSSIEELTTVTFSSRCLFTLSKSGSLGTRLSFCVLAREKNCLQINSSLNSSIYVTF